MNNNFNGVDYNNNMNQQNQPLNQNGNIQQNSNQTNYYDPNVNNSNLSDFNQSQYYDNGFENDKPSLWEKIKIPVFIVIGLIILVIVIILIVRSCSSSTNKKNVVTDPTDSYKNEYNILTNATDNYFDNNSSKEPQAIGECTTVSLADLANGGYITSDSSEKLNTCDNDDTTINACKLESGRINYSINFSCTDSDLVNAYDSSWNEGSESNLNNNADVKFTFLAQETKVSEEVAGTEEELWKDEVTYPENSYTLISSKSYYRYRDATWHWTKNYNYYYPTNTTNVNSASAYYTSAPAGYTTQGSSATVYKWYVNSHEKYPTYQSVAPDSTYVIRGNAGPDKVVATTDVPATFTYRTIKSGQTIYSNRSLLKTETLTETLYKCKNSDGNWQSGLKDACGTGSSATVPTAIGYKCYYDHSTIAKNDNSGVDEEGYQKSPCKSKIYTYGDWNDWLPAKPSGCTISNTEPILCRSTTGYIYNDKVWEWFTQSKKTYYPSGSENASGENTYYLLPPVANAIKDSVTATTASKWYKSETKDLGYSKVSPEDDAIKGEQAWSGWSDYTLSKPSTNSTRQVEERVKVTLTRTPVEGGINTENITSDYVSEEEMIEALKAKGYNVNTLADVLALDNVTYKVKMYYKNVK